MPKSTSETMHSPNSKSPLLKSTNTALVIGITSKPSQRNHFSLLQTKSEQLRTEDYLKNEREDYQNCRVLY